MSIKINYNNNEITSIEGGKKATLKCKGKLMQDNVVIDATDVSGGNNADTDTLIQVLVGGYTEVKLPNITKLKQYAFYSDKALVNIEMPNSITSIGNHCFDACTNLALTSLPNSITSLGNDAFLSCTNLALTSLPSNLTSIGGFCFNRCEKITITSIPKGVTSIGEKAFNYCTGITYLTFEGTPTTIHDSAFLNCTKLKTINVPWAEGAVAGAPWSATNATINYNYTGEANLITFYVNANGNEYHEYKAEEGMTWGQWVGSKYDTGYQFGFDGNVDGTGVFVADDDGVYVDRDDGMRYLLQNYDDSLLEVNANVEIVPGNYEAW